MKPPKQIIYYPYFFLLALLLLMPVEINFSIPRRINTVPFETITSYMRYINRTGILNLDNAKSFRDFMYILENEGIQNIVANIILFIPIGMYLYHFNKFKIFRWLLYSLLIPVFIECWQLLLCPSRSFDVDDIILNFCGIFIGFIMGYAIYMIFDFTKKQN